LTDQAENRIRALYAPDAHFVGAHDGVAERELLPAWIPLLQSQSGVASAYLARVRHGGSQDARMALCVRVTDGTAANLAVGRCAAVFVSRFGPERPLDILILTVAQESTLRTVCPPFFLADGAAPDPRGAKAAPVTWFELQIAPFAFRLAVLPGQPILFGCSDAAGGQAGTWLLRVKDNPNAAKAFAIGLANVIRTHPVHASEPNEPDKCFQPDALETPSLHLRLAWADGRRWATFYPREAIPASIAELVEACRQLGLKEIASLGGRTLTLEEALREVKTP
jgi:hypothetical protein